MPINVIVGRNNSGKSHLLDLVQAVCTNSLDNRGWCYRLRCTLSEESLKQYFRYHNSGGILQHNHWRNHGQLFVNAEVEWEVDVSNNVTNVNFLRDFNPESPFGTTSTKERLERISRILKKNQHPLVNMSFRRLLSDRDITPEVPSVNLSLSPAGNGATNIIRRFITSSNIQYPREVVHSELLSALNAIFGQDGQFTEIQVQEHDDEKTDHSLGQWEIYLGEEEKGLIALSNSGSGLKTVLLVLINLLVIPKIESQNRSKFVFAFEELENNLHPALLRRLFGYLEKYALNESVSIFLTTHSSTALDYFGASELAQIIHVTHDGTAAYTTTVSAHFDHLTVISQLGVRPSDLLQANGIIWVEGPSDRIYLNRWIHLISKGMLQEGRDYQCAYYGGALLAQTQFASLGEAVDTFINLLRVNANVVVVCDSDRSSAESELKPRVYRIEKEIKEVPTGYIWITDAREIENYLPGEILQEAMNLPAISSPAQYESFFPRQNSSSKPYLEDKLKRKTIDKLDLASKCAWRMTINNMSDRFDWVKRVTDIVDCIQSWNE